MWPCAVTRRGSIPACAGEPFKLDGHLRGRTVYPRVCGGTWQVLHVSCRCRGAGLSPRVRGNHTLVRSSCEVQVKGLSPRVRGNLYPSGSSTDPVNLNAGLSPRVRGNQLPLPGLGPLLGSRVYPRVCGGTIRSAADRTKVIHVRVYPRVCGGTACRKQFPDDI